MMIGYMYGLYSISKRKHNDFQIFNKKNYAIKSFRSPARSRRLFYLAPTLNSCICTPPIDD